MSEDPTLYGNTQQCQHGQLARTCELCEKDHEIGILRDALQSMLDEAAHLAGFSETTECKVVAALDGAADNSPISQFTFQDPRLVLTCAFRYALGRATYMPSVIVNELRRNWHLLAEWEQKQIQGDITAAIETGSAGMDCDVATWKEVLGWKKGGE